MEVESVLWYTVSETRRLSVIRVAAHVTDTPRGITLLAAGSHLIGLTVNAWIRYQYGSEDIAG